MSVTVNWAKYSAVLFDLDGVITPTASVHEQAWTETFADHGFTPADYLRHVDGKPRYDGVASFLASRGVDLPWGDPTDPPGTSTVCAVGNLKNDVFTTVLERDGVTPYTGSLRLLAVLERLDVTGAIVSSSRNARRVLDAAGLGSRFTVVVDGTTAAAEELAGKPAPDTFGRAADLLGVDPSDAVVVEDASAGVAAGVAGRFGAVIGVDRGGNRAALLAAGADLVVDDLSDTIGHDPGNIDDGELR